jgi:hypothetical protein
MMGTVPEWKAKQMKHPKPSWDELDRWENEGGRLAEKAKGGIDRGPWVGRPVEGPSRKNAMLLKALAAAGGSGEAHSDMYRQAMAALMKTRLVTCITYRAGLVIYEITDAGRKFVRDLPSGFGKGENYMPSEFDHQSDGAEWRQ